MCPEDGARRKAIESEVFHDNEDTFSHYGSKESNLIANCEMQPLLNT